MRSNCSYSSIWYIFGKWSWLLEKTVDSLVDQTDVSLIISAQINMLSGLDVWCLFVFFSVLQIYFTLFIQHYFYAAGTVAFTLLFAVCAVVWMQRQHSVLKTSAFPWPTWSHVHFLCTLWCRAITEKLLSHARAAHYPPFNPFIYKLILKSVKTMSVTQTVGKYHDYAEGIGVVPWAGKPRSSWPSFSC